MKTIFKTIAWTTLLLWGTIHQLAAQTKISGTILSVQGQSLPFVNVLLLNAQDSSLVRGEITDNDGSFSFENIAAKDYRLLLSMVGYSNKYSPKIQLKAGQQLTLEPYVLQENVAQLNAVEIVAKKPLFEQKIDRLTVNVATSITSAGSTALEVLERSPGVLVNRQQGGISLLGKEGVVVMINGKINRMPISAVVDFLAGMPSNNIEKIELITTPPANFDAEGNAGFINIVLKQTADYGLNGSYSLTGGYGKGGGLANGSVNFNYRKGRLNLFGDYSYFRQAIFQELRNGRSVDFENVETKSYTIQKRDALENDHNGKLGLDIQLSKKTVVGALFSIYNTHWTMVSNNTATFTKNSALDEVVKLVNNETNNWRHYGANFNIQHTFKEGETLTFDADYLYYKDNQPIDYVNSYFDESGNYIGEDLTFSRKITPLDIAVAKLDYAKSFNEKLNFEVGLKATDSHFTNDVFVEYNQGAGWETDEQLTSKANLMEKVLAAYSTLGLKLNEKTSVKIGLRYEFTDSNLGTAQEANIVDREYGKFFPSLFISRDFNEKNSANISYTRRITRPSFNELAPFILFNDPFTFTSGNSALQPAIANAVKLDYRLSTVLFSLQFTKEDSSIARFQVHIDPTTNRQLNYAENLKDTKVASFTVSFPINPTPWWSMQFSGTAIYTALRRYYEESLYTFSQKGFNIFASQTFTLPKDFSFEISGNYNSKRLFGSYTVKPHGALNFGVQKKFRNDKGTLRLGYDNILGTQVFRYSIKIPSEGVNAYGRLQFVNPLIKLTYTQNFGNKKLKSQRKRATGSEEERGRVN
ncbi:MAG: outer membrane beta-barrel protein [Bacteroidetes bacterium]|nr:outer membrane beta-barrel protein [Bacteroidota bacterium]